MKRLLLSEPFLKGFLEKVALVSVAQPSTLLQGMDEMSQTDRENLSAQLRTRDWDRTAQGMAMTGGGAALGMGAGALLGSQIPDSFWEGKPNWASMVPAWAGTTLGGWLGRQLEMAVLDPRDRVEYRSPERLKERLSSERFPLLVPKEGFLPSLAIPG